MTDREAALKAARKYLADWVASSYAACEEEAITNTEKTLAIGVLADLIQRREYEDKVEALEWVKELPGSFGTYEINAEIARLKKEENG